MKKRVGLFGVVVTLMFFLTACAGSPKKDFINFIKKESKNEINYQFKANISEMKIVDEKGKVSEEPVNKMLEEQISNTSLEGTVQSKKEKEKTIISIKSKLNLLGIKVPVNMVGEFGEKNKMYLSTETMLTMFDMMVAFSDNQMPKITINQDKIKEKYIDFLEFSGTNGLDEPIEEFEAFLDSPKEITKGFVDWLMTVDSSKFTQKEDKVFMKTTKNDVIELLEEFGDPDDKDVKESLKLYKEDLKSLSVTHEIDLKSGTQKISIEMEPKESQIIDAGFAKLTVSVKYKKNDKEIDIKLPKKSSIMSVDDLTSLMIEETLSDFSASDFDGSVLNEELPKESVKEEDIKAKLFRPNSQNPESDEEVSYKSDGNVIETYVPDYSQYKKKDIKKMFGEPNSIITDSQQVVDMLENEEVELIVNEFDHGKITETQGKAFVFSASDISIAMSLGVKVEAWKYNSDYPNIYFIDDEVAFVTPKVQFMEFKGKIGEQKI